MIAANELRIGNIISHFGNWLVVETIKLDVPPVHLISGVGHNRCHYGNIAEAFDGIPLSADILERAGFNWSIYHQAFHFGDMAMNEFYDLNECYPRGYQLSTFKKSHLIGSSILYLHQLQNLYLCLCGEELTINLLSESVK